VSDVVDEFELGMFTEDVDLADGDADEDANRSPTIDILKPGYTDLEATVKTVLDPKPWLQGEGTLRDRTGVADYVIRDGTGDIPSLSEGDRYRFENARVTTNENDIQIVEIRPGATEAKPATQQTGLNRDDDGDQDGDDIEPPTGEYEGTQANVMEALRRNDGEVTIGQLAGVVGNGDTPPEDIRGAVDRLSTQGRVITEDADGRTVVRL